MGATIHGVRKSLCLTEQHTAQHKTKTGPVPEGAREANAQGDQLPLPVRGLFDAHLGAADFACKRRSGRLFYAAGPLARCRSPPFQDFFSKKS